MQSKKQLNWPSPDIIIVTHLSKMNNLLCLQTVEYVVFDEADSLFNMGIAQQLHNILTQLGETPHILLFTSTFPGTLEDFARASLRNPQLVDNRHGIPLIDNVINWDYPSKSKTFVHLVGRVAREGRIGTAYSFVTAKDKPCLLDLHLFLSKPIIPAPTEDTNDVIAAMLELWSIMARVLFCLWVVSSQSVLNLVEDKVRDVIDSSVESTSSYKTCRNAYREYLRSKSLPSKRSIQRVRVRDLPHEGLHQVFKVVLEGNKQEFF